ncbi:MAG: ABC transporter permease [Candidatus Kapabacteria bacterium]|nr:ABC transporter permease [Candidatus Kapabacteria bacterium]
MYSSLIRLIANRFTRSTKKNGFMSFSRGVAFVSVALGSMALIIALAVLDGFDDALHNASSKFTSHIQVQTLNRTPIEHCEAVKKELQQTFPVLQIIEPALQREALIRKRSMVDGVVIKSAPQHALGLESRKIIEGSAVNTSAAFYQVEIGRKLARKLDVAIGDSVFLITTPTSQSLPTESVVKKFAVTGIYETGMAQYDDLYIYIPFQTAQRLFQTPTDACYSFDIWLNDINKAKHFANRMEMHLGYPYYTITIFDLHSSMFAWIEMQKQPIPLVLGLISIVAVFNIVTTLLITVVEKSHSYSILRTLGLSTGSMIGVILNQGAFIGLLGTVTGCLVGFAICWIQSTYGIIHLQGEIYFVDTLPITISFWHYVVVLAVSFGMSVLATLIPGVVAAKISPIAALRFK